MMPDLDTGQPLAIPSPNPGEPRRISEVTESIPMPHVDGLATFGHRFSTIAALYALPPTGLQSPRWLKAIIFGSSIALLAPTAAADAMISPSKLPFAKVVAARGKWAFGAGRDMGGGEFVRPYSMVL